MYQCVLVAKCGLSEERYRMTIQYWDFRGPNHTSPNSRNIPEEFCSKSSLNKDTDEFFNGGVDNKLETQVTC